MRDKIILISLSLIISNSAFALDMKGISPVNPLEKTEAYQSRGIIPSFEL